MKRAIGMLQTGATQDHVARIMGCFKCTIARLVTRHRQTGSTADRPRSGRHKVTAPHEDSCLRVLHLRSRFLNVTSSSSANSLGHPVSRRIVARRLRLYGPPVSTFQGHDVNVPTPTSHTEMGQDCTAVAAQRNWRGVLFGDESRCQLFKSDGRVRIYRRRGEWTACCCVQEVEPYGGGSVMVRGGICGDQKTDLVIIDGNLTARRYMDEVLLPVKLPFLQRHPWTLFQQDNATLSQLESLATF
ncbi:uncharacterized protein LOC125379242 [Haliotis rufescens]|uniref:uncharacterized protein LOC125379242 n=1 Tax=Haliotis rufescens TaxID=6454 RepID=UPI00201F3B26|nr:uncharacterized protein LOC125379242 [Haliotis rufescens]